MREFEKEGVTVKILPITAERQSPSGCAATSFFCVIKELGMNIPTVEEFISLATKEGVPLLDLNYSSSLQLIGLANWGVNHGLVVQLWQEAKIFSWEEEIQSYSSLLTNPDVSPRKKIHYEQMARLFQSIMKRRASFFNGTINLANIRKEISTGHYLLPVLEWQKWNSSFFNDPKYQDYPLSKHVPVVYGYGDEGLFIMDPYYGSQIVVSENKLIKDFGTNRIIIEIKGR